jgi:hypothetical protein
VLIALFLIFNPLYLPVLNLDLSAHTYAVEPVSIEDGTIDIAGDSLWDGTVDGIACSGGRPAAACAAERERVQEGDFEFSSTSTPVQIETQYVSHPTDGQAAYYRRTLDHPTLPRAVILEPADPETVVKSVAVSPEKLSLRGRLALALGWMQTDQPLADANRIADTDDGYVMLVEARRTSLSSGDTVESGISMLTFLLGLAVLWRTYNRLPVEW